MEKVTFELHILQFLAGFSTIYALRGGTFWIPENLFLLTGKIMPDAVNLKGQKFVCKEKTVLIREKSVFPLQA